MSINNVLYQRYYSNTSVSTSLIYPQTVTLYQVDDQIYEPEEVATTNLFNTFLDALDGVRSLVHLMHLRPTDIA